MILSMGSSVLMVPFILYYLNDDDTALYYIFSSLSAVALLFDFGFSPSMARSMTYAWSGSKELQISGVKQVERSEPNYKLMLIVVKTCKLIYSMLSLIALILSLTIGTFYVLKVSSGNSRNSILIAWVIYAFAIFTNILYSYYSVFLRGVGAVTKVNLATIVSKVIQMILCIVFLISGAGLVGVSIAYFAYGLLFRFLAKYWFYEYEDIGKSLRKVDISEKISKLEIKEVLKTIWPNTWRDGVVTVSNYFLNQATTIIASLFISLQETGVYSLCVQLTSVIATVSATLYTTYQPALQAAYAKRDKEKQKKYMSIIVTSYVLIFSFGMVALLLIGIPILKVLKPSYSINYVIMLGVGFYQFLLKFRNCYTSFISTTNRIDYWRAFLISAIVCVILSLFLAGSLKLGTAGLICAQLLSQLMYNAWYWPLRVQKELNYNFFRMILQGGKELLYLIKGKINFN